MSIPLYPYRQYTVRRYRYENVAQRNELLVLLGPYCLEPALIAQLASPLRSTCADTWFVATDPWGKLASFAAVRLMRQKAVLVHAFTLPEHRPRGLNDRLTQLRCEYAADAGASRIEVTVASERRDHYMRHGFDEAGRRGRWAVMQKNLAGVGHSHMNTETTDA